MARLRSKREAEREAHDEERRLVQLAAIERRKRETGYDGFWHHQPGAQSVCQICFAVVTDTDGHTKWHAMLGQRWSNGTLMSSGR
jgi:hypothetical protein